MKLTMLGTGHATVTKGYNTCFVLSEQDRHFLVDAGGGNQILRILEEEAIPLSGICDIFVSHAHTDHVLGVVWMIRMAGQRINQGKYEGRLRVFCHQELSEEIQTICRITLPGKITRLFGERIVFAVVQDGQMQEIIGHNVRFFDIGSAKMKQFGFAIRLDGGRQLAFAGDEPLSERASRELVNYDWLMHEAFCLYEERDIFHPYEKYHSTVKDACESAERLGIKNLILYHTEDTHLQERKQRYTLEGKKYFSGNLFVPDDREAFEI